MGPSPAKRPRADGIICPQTPLVSGHSVTYTTNITCLLSAFGLPKSDSLRILVHFCDKTFRSAGHKHVTHS